MTALSAISISCPSCGAPLPLDLDQETATCAHCHGTKKLTGAEIEATRRYLTQVRELASDLVQTGHTARMVVAARKPLGLSLIVLTIVAFNLPDLTDGLFWSGPILMVVLGVYLTLAARSGAQAPTSLGQIDCPSCGASMPFLAHKNLVCPFCQCALLPAEEARQAGVGIERAALSAEREHVATEEQQLTNALRRSHLLGSNELGVVVRTLEVFSRATSEDASPTEAPARKPPTSRS
jgi:uncharacterized Zn finger protein (UPF0148 family)